MKRITKILAGMAALALAGSLQAQEYPSKRISFVVSVPPGASADGLARIMAEKLSGKDRLGQAVVVENKPGAGAYLGADFVAKAAPDGYTILLAGQQMSAPRAMYPIEGFDPSKLVALGRLASSPFIIVAPSEVPAKTLPEFIAFAKANPGKLNYGVVPNTAMQLDMIQFGQITGTRITEVPFNGAAPISTSLLGNQIQMGFLGVSAIPHIQSGKLKALAVASKARWSRLPDVPSLGDLGIDFESGFWYGVAAPAGTPQPIIDRLTREFVAVNRLPEVREAIVKMGMDPVEPSPAEMNQTLQRERTHNEAAFRILKPAGK